MAFRSHELGGLTSPRATKKQQGLPPAATMLTNQRMLGYLTRKDCPSRIVVDFRPLSCISLETVVPLFRLMLESVSPRLTV